MKCIDTLDGGRAYPQWKGAVKGNE